MLVLLGQADVILTVGYDPIEMRAGWRNAWQPSSQKIIELMTTANDHYMHQASLSWVCNINSALQQLVHATAQKQSWPQGQPAATRAVLRETFTAGDEWGPAAIIAGCRRNLPTETIATADSGAHRILLSQMWTCYEPRTLLQSTGLCTMGCAVPLAVGAKIAEPHRPVVAFTGDAGMLMVLGELATVAELGSRIIIVVFVDSSLALIEMKQRGRQLPNLGVDFAHVDFAGVATSLGGIGETVSTADELDMALQSALVADRFTVIACEFDRQAYDGTF